jgi:hypothetical protein
VFFSKVLQMIGHEVADPGRPHPTVGEQCLQRAVRLQCQVEPGGQRLVQDQQIDPVDAELAGTLVEGVQGRLVAVVTDPDLGLDEHLGPVHTGATNSLARLALVAVRGRGVDVAIGPVRTAVSTASAVSTGGVWKTPKPSAGISPRCSTSASYAHLHARSECPHLGGTRCTPFTTGEHSGELDDILVPRPTCSSRSPFPAVLALGVPAALLAGLVVLRLAHRPQLTEMLRMAGRLLGRCPAEPVAVS